MSTDQLIIVGLYLFVFLPVIGYVYGRQGRWRGTVGWALLIGGQIFLALGGGNLFAWAGLAGLFVSAAGLLLVISDLVDTWLYHRRRRRE